MKILSLPLNLKKEEANLVIRFSKHKGNSLTKLEALYDFMNKLYGFIKQYTPCKKSCSHCCYYEISLSEVEIQFIERSLKIKRSKNEYLGDFYGVPCPFLKNQVCSIYFHRPFVCRRHVILHNSSTYCHVDVANKHETLLPRFSEVDKVYEMIILQENQSDIIDIKEILFDIRKIFSK